MHAPFSSSGNGGVSRKASHPAHPSVVPPLAGFGAAMLSLSGAASAAGAASTGAVPSSAGSTATGAVSPRASNDDWNPGSARVHFSGLPPDLVAAAWRGDRALVAKLLGRRESLVTLREEESARTLLHVCAVRGHARLLADVWFFSSNSQPPIDVRDRSGATALQLACHHGHMRVAVLLLRFGADPNAICSSSSSSALSAAVASSTAEQHTEREQSDCSDAAAAAAAADELTWVAGLSPLHLLLLRPCPQPPLIPLYRHLLLLLCRQGARLSLTDRAGLTPLHLAAAQGRALTASLLIAAGAQPDPCSRNGRTPLHLACAAGHAPTVALLLYHGSSPSGFSAQRSLPGSLRGRRTPPGSAASDDDRSPQRLRSGSPLFHRPTSSAIFSGNNAGASSSAAAGSSSSSAGGGPASGSSAVAASSTLSAASSTSSAATSTSTSASAAAPPFVEKYSRPRSRPRSPPGSGELRSRRTPSSSGSEAEYADESDCGDSLPEPLTIARRLRRPDIGALLGFRVDHALAAPPPASLLYRGDCVLGDELPVCTREERPAQLHPAYLLAAKRSCAVLTLPRFSRAQLHSLQLQLRLRVGHALALPQPRPPSEHSEAADEPTAADLAAIAEQHLLACDDEWDRIAPSSGDLSGADSGDSEAGVDERDDHGDSSMDASASSGSCGHYNVIEWLAVEEHGERVHVVMDSTRLRAQSVYEYAASFPDRRLPESECCHLLAQLASALCFLQERCRVQRELFDEHVLLLDPSQIFVQAPSASEEAGSSSRSAFGVGPRRLLVGTLRVVDHGMAHVDSSLSDAASSAAFTLQLPASLRDVAARLDLEAALDSSSTAAAAATSRSGCSPLPDGRLQEERVRLIPPEVLEGGFVFGSVIDAWTCGVVLHVLACGELPYRLSSDPVPRKRYIQLYLDVYRGAWHRARAQELLSSEFVDLLSQLLRPDPSARLSVSEIRRHPCMTKHGKALRSASATAASATATVHSGGGARGSRGFRRAKLQQNGVGSPTAEQLASVSPAQSPARRRPENSSPHASGGVALHGVGAGEDDSGNYQDGAGEGPPGKGMLRLPRRGHQRKRSMHDYASITGTVGSRSTS